MNNFDLKKFLTENKLTSNSRLDEDREVEFGDRVKYKGEVVRVSKVLSADKLVIMTTNAQGDFEKQEIDKKELDEPVTLKHREPTTLTPKPKPKPEPVDKEEDKTPSDYYEGKKEFSVYTTSGQFHSYLEEEYGAELEMDNDDQYYGEGTVSLSYEEVQQVEEYGAYVDIENASVEYA